MATIVSTYTIATGFPYDPVNAFGTYHDALVAAITEKLRRIAPSIFQSLAAAPDLLTAPHPEFHDMTYSDVVQLMTWVQKGTNNAIPIGTYMAFSDDPFTADNDSFVVGRLARYAPDDAYPFECGRGQNYRYGVAIHLPWVETAL